MRLLTLCVGLALLPACASRPILSEGAVVERVATGYTFTEGPAGDGKGNVYFTDIPAKRILRFEEATGQVHVFREESGAANGLMFDKQGRLYACEGGARRVTRNDVQTGEQTVIASHYEGKRFNSPNDLVLDGRGGLYFTDPRYGPRNDLELDTESVYYIERGGEVRRQIKDLVRPNGIILSPDGSRLYVADNGAKNIWEYTVKATGDVRAGHVLAWMNREADGGPDGMTVDAKGNVYAAGQGHIWIWNKKGELLHKIPVPENPSNCAFAGKGSGTLYITAVKSLYRIELDAEGIR